MANKGLVKVRDGALRALTPEREEAIVAAVGRGVPLATAARTVGIGERTLRGWLRVAAEDRTTWEDGVPISTGAKADVLRFAGRIEQAMAECEAKCAEAITAAVGVVGKSGVPEWPGARVLEAPPGHAGTVARVPSGGNHPHRRVPRARAGQGLSDDELRAELLSLPPGG